MPRNQTCPRFYGCPHYLQVWQRSDQQWSCYPLDNIFPIISLWELSFGNRNFDPICAKTFCSLSPTPMMLHIKFDKYCPTCLRNIQVWKCGRMDVGPLVYYKLTLWALGSGELKMEHISGISGHADRMWWYGSHLNSMQNADCMHMDPWPYYGKWTAVFRSLISNSLNRQNCFNFLVFKLLEVSL